MDRKNFVIIARLCSKPPPFINNGPSLTSIYMLSFQRKQRCNRKYATSSFVPVSICCAEPSASCACTCPRTHASIHACLRLRTVVLANSYPLWQYFSSLFSLWLILIASHILSLQICSSRTTTGDFYLNYSLFLVASGIPDLSWG